MARAVGKQSQVPPSVGGLNANDAITSMPPQDAVTLDNWFPEATYLRIRRGASSWATGFSAPVQSLMEYRGTSPKLFAASGTAIYDVSTAGAIGAASLSGLTNALWQSIMFSNASGTYLVAVNGADGVRTYNGSAWATQTITGVTATGLVQVASFKRRLWFAENASTKAWYLGTDAISGAATSLDLGGIWRLGGNLARIFAMSYDTYGGGLTEYIGFLSTMGELAVYAGTDPSSSSTWSLVGTFRIAGPAGSRATTQVGGDIRILTHDGVVSLLDTVRLDPSQAQEASNSQKITPLLSDDYQTYSGLTGWQIINHPAVHAMLVNVPTSNSTFRQYVMNTLTGAWCRFTGWNAYCFGTFGDALYFGASNRVVKAWTGLDDEGSAIPAIVQTSFNASKAPGTNKRYTLVRPLVQATAQPNAMVGVSVDYTVDSPAAPYSTTQAGSVWGTALWDAGTWGLGMTNRRDWASVGAFGRAASITYSTSTIGVDLQINGFDLMYEPAGGPSL